MSGLGPSMTKIPRYSVLSVCPFMSVVDSPGHMDKYVKKEGKVVNTQ